MRMNISNFIIDKVRNVELWVPVPIYEKLDVLYCIESILRYLLFANIEARDNLKFYLETRKINNKKYKDFWSDTSNIKFNCDKTAYVQMHFDEIIDVNRE